MRKENLTVMGVFLALSVSAAGVAYAGSVKKAPSADVLTKVAKTSNPFKLPDGGEGSGLYLYSLTSALGERGLFELSLDGDMTHLWSPATDGVHLFNGWLNNGNVCGFNSIVINENLEILRYDELDFDTGSLVSSQELDPNDYLAYFRQCVYVPSTNRIFGIGGDERNWSCVKYMEMDDLSKVTVVKNINYTQYLHCLCYNPYDQNVYAVTESKKFVRIDQETGDYEELMDLEYSSARKNFVHGLTYLPTSDEYLFGLNNDDWATELYRIDLESGIITEALQLPNAETIAFFINTDPGDPEVPLRPQYVSKNFSGGSLTGSFNYTLPTMLASGDEATGTLTWTLLVDGEEAATGEGAPGTEIEANVTVSQGTHFLEMCAGNNGHNGPTNKMYVYVGNDVPMAPQNVVLTEGKVTWDAVTEGVNGGYLDMDDLFYEVYINNEYVGETTETELTFSVSPDNAYSKHVAEVKAICSDIESESGISNPALYGNPLKLDANFSPTVEEATLFTSMSAGGDNVMWGYSDSEQGFATNSPYSEFSEAFLVTPPIEFLDAEAVYSVAFDSKIIDNWGANPTLTVYLMNERSEDGIVKELMPAFEGVKNEYKNYSEIFTIPQDGTYFIGFKCASSKYANPAALKNIAICLTDIPSDTPTACTDVVAEAGLNGKLSAEVTLTLPVKDLLGRDIPAETEVTATVTCGENSNSVTGAPGSVQKVEVATVQGMNELVVVSSIDEKIGQSTSVMVFTGKDRPGAPRNFKATVGEDNQTVTLTWDAPAEGADGNYFDTEDLNYRLYYRQGWFSVDLGTISDGSQELVYTFPESESMSQYKIYLVPSNIAGEGISAEATAVVGKPYALPMNETVEGGSLHYFPVTLEYPSDSYRSALLYIIPPYQLQEVFYNYEHSAIAAFPGVEGESYSRLALPKFSTISDNEEYNSVLASFEMWTGDMMASEITLLGRSWDMDEPIEIGKVEAGSGWVMVDFCLPEELMNKEWITLMFDSRYDTALGYTMIYTYNIEFTTLDSVEGIANADASVYAEGSNVYINGLEGNSYAIYTMDGRTVKSGDVKEPAMAVGVEPGVYVVRAGGISAKVIVR